MTSISQALSLATARRFIDWWAAELSELVSTSARRRAWDIMFVRRETGCDVFVRSRERIEQVGTPQTGSDALLAELHARRCFLI